MKAVNPNRENHMFEFGPFRLDTAERHLLRDGEPVTIPPKAFDTLLVLVENRGHAVKKDELIAAVWPDTFVEENNLTQYVSVLRKALGEGAGGERYIETVPRWGYRFVGDVREAWDEGEELTLRRRTRSSVVIREEQVPEPARRVAPKAIAATAAAVVLVVAMAFAWGASRPAPGVAHDVRSVAVLPFASLDASAGENAHLELGMADAVINRLGRLRRISVRATSAVQKYAGTDRDPVAVGRALGVDAVLEGRIQRSGDRIRVTVQLVSARDGASLWTEKFDEELANVFALQDAIAARVARGLAPVLDGETLGPAARPTDSATAYDAYLRGRYLWSKRTTESVRASIAHFQAAIDADPNFALAYAGLADAYSIQAAPLAEPALRKALELDDTIGEAHASMGFYRLFFHWDVPMADQELRLAVALSPNYATAHQWYALSLAVRGRLDEAKAEMAAAIECDPLSPNMRADMAQLCFFAGDYDAAIAHCRAALELEPDFQFAHHYLGAAYARKGMYDEAVGELVWSLEAGGASPEVVAAHRAAYEAAGWPGVCRVRLERGSDPPTTEAILLMQVGEPERAIEALRRGLDERDFFLIFLAVEPDLAPLRSDPRFLEIARRVGVVDQNRAR